MNYKRMTVGLPEQKMQYAAVVVTFHCHCRTAHKRSVGQSTMQQQQRQQRKRPHQTHQTNHLEFGAAGAEPTGADVAAAVNGNRDDNSSTKTKSSSLRPASIDNDSAPLFRSSSFVGSFCRYNSFKIN